MNKAARSALITAKRLKFADGGLTPLLQPSIETTLEDQEGKQSRRWLPPEYVPEGSNSGEPVVPDMKTIKHDPVAPVFHSVAHEALADPKGLGGMKQGNPQAWINRLKQAGAKKEDIDRLGLDKLGPNEKVTRDVLHQRSHETLPMIGETIYGRNDGKAYDEDNDPYEGVSTRVHDWQTEDPDDSYIDDRARDSVYEHVKSNIDDPDWAEDYVPEALKTFADQHLTSDNHNYDPDIQRRRMEFANTALNHGWINHGHAESILHPSTDSHQRDNDWDRLVRHATDEVAHRFNRPALHDQQQEELPGIPRRETPTDTSEWLEDFDVAADKFNPSAPNVADHLKKHIENDDDLFDSMRDQELRYYYDDDEVPRTASVTVEGPGNDVDDYEIRDEGYGGGYSVYSPNGVRIGHTHSQDEAEDLIRSHAVEEGHFGDPADVSEPDPEIAQKVPEVHGGPKYATYALPGLTNYREHTMQYQSPAGTFDGSHFGNDTVVHMRYGDAHDTMGKRLLYLDELQSDWHQHARDSGYYTAEDIAGHEEKKRKAGEAYAAAEQAAQDAENAIYSKMGLDGSQAGYDTPMYLARILAAHPTNEHEFSDLHRLYASVSNEDRSNLFGREHHPSSTTSSQQDQATHTHIHDVARRTIGNDYKRLADEADATRQRARELYSESYSQGPEGYPDAPWKDSADWSKFAMRRAMRIAADYGYDGVALSPGWVQQRRWGGNEDHKKLYDEVFGNVMHNVAKENGLKVESAELPILHSHNGQSGRTSEPNNKFAKTVYLTPEARENIRKKPQKLFKRGGAVKRLRRADGGPTMRPPLLGYQPIEAVLEDEQGQRSREWLPPSELPPKEEGDQSPVLYKGKRVTGAEPVSPVFRSLVHDTLSEPNSLGGLKAGNPQQWVNALKKVGAKKEELEHFGVGEGNPNEKITREALLSRVRQNLPKLSAYARSSVPTEDVSSTPEWDPYTRERANPSFYNGTNPSDWQVKEPDYDAFHNKAAEMLAADPKLLRLDPQNTRLSLEDGALDRYINKWLKVRKHAYEGDPYWEIEAGNLQRPTTGWFDPNALRKQNVYNFLKDAVDNDWVSPSKAKAVADGAQNGRILLNDWKDMHNDLRQGVLDKLEKNEGGSREPDQTFPGMEPAEDWTVEGELGKLDAAVGKLHGFSTKDVDDANPPEGLSRGAFEYSSRFERPNILGPFMADRHYEANSRLVNKMSREYFADPNAPRTTTLSLRNLDSDSSAHYGVTHQNGTYTMRERYSRGEPIHTSNDPSELVDAALNHARQNRMLEHRARWRSVPIRQDNITRPMPESTNVKHADYSIPKLEHYTEETLHYEPKEGEFHRNVGGNHYTDVANPVVHVRYGGVKDINGKRLLHVDEVQSDWHQTAKNRGYMGKNYEETRRWAAERHPELEKAHEDAAASLATMLGEPNAAKRPSRVVDYAHMLTMPSGDIHKLSYYDKRHISDALEGTSADGRKRLFGMNEYNYPEPEEAVTRIQDYARSQVGDDFKKMARAFLAAKQAKDVNNNVKEGYANPEAPWKDSSEHGKLVLKYLLRRAADYGYEGLSLSPGWVQRERWGNNWGHMHLYDNILAGALKAAASEKGLKVGMAEIPNLSEYAHNRLAYQGHPEHTLHVKHPDVAPAVYFAPEDVQKIRKEPFNVFKRGGVAKGPTEAQKEAGNYKKKHVSFQGLDIAIENEKGSQRSGVGPGGKHWTCTMPADYGYIKRTEGADGDHVDCYIGPDKNSTHVFIVNQCDHRTGKFDEHKCILGCNSEKQALDLYAAGFSDGKGRARASSVEPMSLDTFKHWLKKGDTTKRAATPAIVNHALQLTGKYVYKHH